MASWHPQPKTHARRAEATPKKVCSSFCMRRKVVDSKAGKAPLYVISSSTRNRVDMQGAPMPSSHVIGPMFSPPRAPGVQLSTDATGKQAKLSSRGRDDSFRRPTSGGQTSSAGHCRRRGRAAMPRVPAWRSPGGGGGICLAEFSAKTPEQTTPAAGCDDVCMHYTYTHTHVHTHIHTPYIHTYIHAHTYGASPCPSRRVPLPGIARANNATATHPRAESSVPGTCSRVRGRGVV